MGSFSIWHLLIILFVFATALWLYSTKSPIMTNKYTSHYGTEKLVGMLTFVVGWVLLVLGIVGVIAGVLGASSLASENPNLLQGFNPPRQLFMVAAVAGLGFSVLLVLIGLLMASIGKHLRVTTDAANHLGEILVLMKSGITTSIPEPAMQAPQPEPQPEPQQEPFFSEMMISNPQQEPEAIFCSECGATLANSESIFCPHCGVKL